MQHLLAEAAIPQAAACARSWQVWLVLTGTLAVKTALGTLAERSRRKTLKMLCEKAPRDTFVRMQRGRGGPAMDVWIGPDDPPSQQADVIIRPAQRPSRLPRQASRR